MAATLEDQDRKGTIVRTGTEQSVQASDWSGVAGFQRFASSGRFAVADADRFRAAWREAVVDGMRIGEWSSTPITGTQSLRRDGTSAVLIAVLAGSVRYWTGGRTTEAGTGSWHVLSSADPIRFSIPEPSRLLRVIVPAALLPQGVRGAISSTLGQVRGGRIAAGLVALVEEVLDPATCGSASPAARAVRALAVAALEDALPETAERDLREQILEHIDRHLDDPELSPQTIATAFGISLRWVHAVFNVDGASVARHIRERRLDRVAAQLQRERRCPRIGTLAAESGFGARDQLTRAFKARYGMTLAEYAERASHGGAPVEEVGERTA